MLEREREIEALEAALAAARACEGAVVTIEGPAGIGKTSLVAKACARAADRGMAVFDARGSDLERELQWGVVRQLFEGPLVALPPRGRAHALGGAAALAAQILMPGRDTHDAGSADEGALLHGLYWLCANLARETPALVAIDDTHWCDLPSLRFVAYLARRIQGVPLALLVATRRGESPREEEIVSRLAGEPGARLLQPEPLSRDGVTVVLGIRLESEPDARLAAACHEATLGNPFLVEELARWLRERGVEHPDEVADIGPRSVARSITQRLRRLAPGAVEIAHAIAVLGPDAELRRVAMLADLNPGEAAAAVDTLAGAEILMPVRPFDFIHPLVRAAVHGDMPPAGRASLHARAARMLAGDGVAAGRVAAHLLVTEPAGDRWAVEVLRAAAADAIAQGAPPAAVTYLERALSEPPPAAARTAVLRELGRAEGADGRARASEEHLRTAVELAADPHERAESALDLARTVATTDWAAAGDVCLEAISAVPPDDRTRPKLEGELITLALNVYSLMDRTRFIVRARLKELESGVVEDALLVAALGLVLASSVPSAEHGAAVALRASALDLIEYNTNLPGCVGNALLFAGRLEQSARYYRDVGDLARLRGWSHGIAWTLGAGARVSLQLGEVRRAEEKARLALESLDAMPLPGSAVQRGYLTAHLAEVLVERGALDEADVLLSAFPLAEDRATTYGETLVLGARSALRLAQGRPAEALADALASPPTAAEDWNPATEPWLARSAAAHAVLGNHEQAGELAARALERARAFGAPHAIAHALRVAARCSDDRTAAIELLRDAVATVEDTDARLELAHSVVELGSALRRGGRRRDGIEALRRGLDLAHRCGATPLAAHAHAELRIAGARPRRALISGIDALTAAERRIANLAAEGMTNQQIAETLFVTARTVEGHLTHVYQKLGIASRHELPAALEPTGAE